MADLERLVNEARIVFEDSVLGKRRQIEGILDRRWDLRLTSFCRGETVAALTRFRLDRVLCDGVQVRVVFLLLNLLESDLRINVLEELLLAARRSWQKQESGRTLLEELIQLDYLVNCQFKSSLRAIDCVRAEWTAIPGSGRCLIVSTLWRQLAA